jgi:hypothetical protein
MALGEIGLLGLPLSLPRDQIKAKEKADQKNDRPRGRNEK